MPRPSPGTGPTNKSQSSEWTRWFTPPAWPAWRNSINRRLNKIRFVSTPGEISGKWHSIHDRQASTCRSKTRWPTTLNREHIACIASIHPPTGVSAEAGVCFRHTKMPRRTPPGQPNETQGAQAGASSHAHAAASAQDQRAQICAVLTKRSCVSCGRAMAR